MIWDLWWWGVVVVERLNGLYWLKKKNVFKGGEASSWDRVQKLKKHLKHFFTKFQLSTIYRFWNILFQSWEISPTVLPFEI